MLTYDASGQLLSTSYTARTQGTSVSLSNLFASLPVRYRVFMKQLKREYSRMLSMVQAYALISTGVRFTATHVQTKGGRNLVFSTGGSVDQKDLITNVYGSKQSSQVERVDCSLEGDSAHPLRRDGPYRLQGWVSKGFEGGRSSGDRQYVYVNHRPVDLPKVQRAINDGFRAFTTASSTFPFVVLDLLLPTDAYDVNVTPNKRTVLLHDEDSILHHIRAQLTTLWAPSQQTFTVKRLDSYVTCSTHVKREKSDSEELPSSLPDLEPASQDADAAEEEHKESAASAPVLVKREPGTVTVSTTATSVQSAAAATAASASTDSSTRSSAASSTPLATGARASVPLFLPSPSKRQKLNASTRGTASPLRTSPRRNLPPLGPRQPQLSRFGITDDASGSAAEAVEVKGQSEGHATEEAMAVDSEESAPSDMVAAASPSPSRTIHVNLDAIRRHWQARAVRSTPSPPPAAPHSVLARAAEKSPLDPAPSDAPPSSSPSCTDHSHSDDTSQPASSPPLSLGGDPSIGRLLPPSLLSRVVSKGDFLRMRVLGQFNLGFIITALNDSDLFIIDQHAADEKHRYEQLVRTSSVQQQPLITPLPLHLSPAQVELIHAHLPTFTSHGFSFTVTPPPPSSSSSSSASSPPTLALSTLPYSRDKAFGPADVQELVDLIAEGVAAPMLPKLRALHASRACRGAVMIGDGLDVGKMEGIVRHMGEMEQPWACPHGRPTMRHLVDLSLIQAGRDTQKEG